ncbi:hypothetical protein CNY89_14430, partial [Amaricoccus sp. HAR-UPW-R2A-40]
LNLWRKFLQKVECLLALQRWRARRALRRIARIADDGAADVGAMYRGAENALPVNWLSIPIGYNGRASSVVVSGTDFHRPWGQVKGPDDVLPRFAPSARLDLELEFGTIVGTPSKGMISVAEADDMIFGYVLLNDWSARDIQTWEYQPQVRAWLGGQADVVMSDMAAAASGHPQTDYMRIVALCEVAADLAEEVLAPGGVFVSKVLGGGAEPALVARLNKSFAKVAHVKPPASRKDSSEKFLVATGFRGAPKEPAPEG